MKKKLQLSDETFIFAGIHKNLPTNLRRPLNSRFTGKKRKLDKKLINQ
jgi:hypothetical protein